MTTFTRFKEGHTCRYSPSPLPSPSPSSQCGNMAREGLRTLVVGKKVLSEEQYSSFEARYKQARLSVADRDEQVHMYMYMYMYMYLTSLREYMPPYLFCSSLPPPPSSPPPPLSPTR